MFLIEEVNLIIVNVIFGEFYDVKMNYCLCKEFCEEYIVFVLL